PLLTAGSLLIGRLRTQVQESKLSARGKSNILFSLKAKESEIGKAIGLSRGVTLRVMVDEPVGTNPEGAFMAVPGQTFEVTARLSAGDHSTINPSINLLLPQGWNSKVLSRETDGNGIDMRFKVYVPPTAAPTRPYWHRNDPETEALNIIDDAQYHGLPFPPPPVKALGQIGKPGGFAISTICMVRYKDASGAIAERPLAVAPAFSVMLDPGEQVIPTEDGPQSTVKVDVSSNLDSKKMPETHWAGDPENDQGVL